VRKIIKGYEPQDLSDWKRNNKAGRYQDISHIERQAIKNACLKEQFYLCAYCCKQIDPDNSNNEHVIAQQLAPCLTLEFSNIIASCTTPRQCNDAHKSQPLPLTPLMAECEKELCFKLSGKVEGLSIGLKKVFGYLIWVTIIKL
jgi:uncharacterized protein (TIGR02646 family)